METRRVFIALDLPRELRERMAELPRLLGTPDAKIRWVDPQQMHLTLKFAGEATAPQVQAMAEMVRKTGERFSPLQLAVGELGAFPSRRNPRVIWVGIQANDSLVNLHKYIEEGVRDSGLNPDEREFSPHLTLGRVKFVRNNSPLLDRLRSVRVETFHYLLETVTLLESTLTPEGAQHQVLERVRLAGDEN